MPLAAAAGFTMMGCGAELVGDDVIDGAGGGGGCVELDRIDPCAIEEGGDAEVLVGVWCGNRRGEVGVRR